MAKDGGARVWTPGLGSTALSRFRFNVVTWLTTAVTAPFALHASAKSVPLQQDWYSYLLFRLSCLFLLVHSFTYAQQLTLAFQTPLQSRDVAFSKPLNAGATFDPKIIHITVLFDVNQPSQ